PSIGGPIVNTRIHVLDRYLRPVPPGVPGELYVAGPGLARGYLGQPDRTSTRFVADVSGVPGARMYRTGDLVRFDRDGRLHFVGRTDDQVKLRGFRIEPGEVESVLRAHADVVHAAVIVRDQRLIAYVVPAEGVEVDTRALREHAAATVPGYMVPGLVVPVDRLPVTANGKLDRDALPDPRVSAGGG